MARYKGQFTRKHVEREFPHWVEIQNPDGGWWRQYDAIESWHRARAIQNRSGDGGKWHRRFCFAEPETADEFQAAFGGERRTAEPMRKAAGR